MVATPNGRMKCHMPELPSVEHQSGFVFKEHGLFCVNPSLFPWLQLPLLLLTELEEKATPHCPFLTPVSGECTMRQDLK